METRDWEKWDQPGVVEEIRRLWKNPAEIAHRQLLAQRSSEYLKEGDSFLEIGCGSGLMYWSLSQCTKIKYTGIDTSQEMIRAAQDTFPGVTFQEGDAFNIPFPDGSFDAVAAYDVLQHVPDIAGIIRELLRVSGRMVFFTLLEGKTVRQAETICGNTFLQNFYSMDDAKAIVEKEAGNIPYKVIKDTGTYSHLWVLTKNLP